MRHTFGKYALGMTAEEVVEILGKPFSIERQDARSFGRDTETMHYTRHVRSPFFYHYPMLWIHLKEGRVTEVYAKEYNGPDDWGVYGLSERGRWETAGFEPTFPARGAVAIGR